MDSEVPQEAECEHGIHTQFVSQNLQMNWAAAMMCTEVFSISLWTGANTSVELEVLSNVMTLVGTSI